MSLISIALIMSMQAPDNEARYYDPGPVDPELGSAPAEIERKRIQRHLRTVEQTLRAETPADLPAPRRAAREAALDALRDYWVAGEFPKNRDYHDRRVPYFIDDDGTACAVGHLMIASGADELAREIATYENNDFVAEIDHPGVDAWLEANGLSVAEAAWIQPSYGPCGFSEDLVCGTDGNTYLCPFVATECAGVEIDHEGACGTDTDGTTGGVGEVIGEEICPATSTTAGTDAGDSSTAGSEGTGGSATGDSTGGSTQGDSAGDDPDDDKGCSVGGRHLPAAYLAALLVGLARRRRTKVERASRRSA